ncbi:MAG: sodium-dependent transporter [Bacteroidales bacterium]|nr:sodium-dependent transporter [Bacteroidales bacterium]
MSQKSIKQPLRLVTESWGTRVGLVLAMAGNAVGFGNFLRFPVQAVQNGGGAFIIPYLISLVILGLPLLLIEWSSGRWGGKHGHHSTPFILHSLNSKALWKYVGVFGIFCNVAIASYYCYIESWTMSYIYHSIAGTFNGLDQHQTAGFFENYLDVTTSTTGIPFEGIIFYVFCLALNTWILSKGLSGGVEKASKIGVPLLIFFGIFLAIRGITMKAGSQGAIFDGFEGLNFLWTPQFDSLTNPKVWLAAAGQIFFTLSVGMGSIQCYASYLKEKDDIAANAMSAGFMNEFVEIVLGSSIIIPISVGYLGIDRVVELTGLGGLGLAFRTMPFLFEQWGAILSAVAGAAFFGLLFFAGITSSLAMGTPVLGFMKDEFKWPRERSALAFGILVLILGLPTVFFFQQGVFDEYDYWAGTVSLVVFAMLEAILFAWFYGADKGWAEIQKGADIKIPGIFRYLIKYVTPVVLIIVFFGSLIRPVADDWSKISIRGWELHNESILGQIMHKGIGPNNTYFADTLYSENAGVVDSVFIMRKKNFVRVSPEGLNTDFSKKYRYTEEQELLVKVGDRIDVGTPIIKGEITNRLMYIDLARGILLTVFAGIALLVFIAYRKRKREKNI